MKCVRGEGRVIRVTDDKADMYIKEKGYKLVPKRIWKESGGKYGKA